MAHAAIYANTPAKERGEFRNQVSYGLWNGSVTVTSGRAKSVQSGMEKILTLAINSYEDVIKTTKEVTNSKGVKVKKQVLIDGPKKLNARRRIMAKVYDLHEVKTKAETKKSFTERTKNINHPLIEKIFNELAPRYAKRAKELGQGGGYTRILKLGARRGDNAEMCLIELV